MLSESSSPKISGAGGTPQACISQSLDAASVLPSLPLNAVIKLLIGVQFIGHVHLSLRMLKQK